MDRPGEPAQVYDEFVNKGTNLTLQAAEAETRRAAGEREEQSFGQQLMSRGGGPPGPPGPPGPGPMAPPPPEITVVVIR